MASADPQTVNFSIAHGDSLQIEVTIDDVPVGVTPTLKWRLARSSAEATPLIEVSATATQANGVWSALLTVPAADSAINLTPGAPGYVHRVHVYSGATLRATPIVGAVSVAKAATG